MTLNVKGLPALIKLSLQALCVCLFGARENILQREIDVLKQ